MCKENDIDYQKLEKDWIVNSEDLYNYLYNEYFIQILNITKTKKNLFEILYANNLFNVTSLYAFYKKGVESYIPSGKSRSASDFIKLIELTGCSIEDDDCLRINSYKKCKSDLESYFKKTSTLAKSTSNFKTTTHATRSKAQKKPKPCKTCKNCYFSSKGKLKGKSKNRIYCNYYCIVPEKTCGKFRRK